MEIAEIGEDSLVLNQTCAERVPARILLLCGFGFVGISMYGMHMDYPWNDREPWKPWLMLLAPGIAQCLVGLYLFGLEKRVVFRRHLWSCECTISWFRRWSRSINISPAGIICSEHYRKGGRNVFRITVYHPSDVRSGRFGPLIARLKGRSVHLGDFKSKKALDEVLKEVSAFTGKRVVYHKEWTGKTPRMALD